jgi:hypothetical protein
MTPTTIEAVKTGEPEAARTGASGRVHLASLDGLRGLAAGFHMIFERPFMGRAKPAALQTMGQVEAA